MAERQIVPGETARFPFTVYSGEPAPSIHDFEVASDNPKFDPAWAHIVRTSETHPPQYTLQIHPTRRFPYGTYPLYLSWPRSGMPGRAESRCTLIIKPCLRLTAEPTFATWPSGTLTLSLENCGIASIDVKVSVSHHGSDWSQGWEFELDAEKGPFEFSEKFVPPAGSRGGEFELEVSAEGVSVIHLQLQAKRVVLSRKRVVTSAVLLTGAAIGTGLSIAFGGATDLARQSITFTSASPTGPAPGQTYHVEAIGGGSGKPVIFTIDPSSAQICSVSSSTVTFRKAGTCVIDADQAGNDSYLAAPQAQQSVSVIAVPRHQQAISFTAPALGQVGQSATLSAKGGRSGNVVVFSVDPSSDPGVCAVSGANGKRVSYTGAGRCVIDANQAGKGTYAPAHQVQRTIKVARTAQSISFTAPVQAQVTNSAKLSATGGRSGNPVRFSVDPSSDPGVCAVSGANGTKVSYTGAGRCVIDASQEGNDTYAPAPQVKRTIQVAKIPQSIDMTVTGPDSPYPGDTATLSATGGDSGIRVVFSVDPSSDTGACEMDSADVTKVDYTGPGRCVIDADQAGNDAYEAAPQVQQTVVVNPPVYVR
ncbi:hypothetical protein [Intrasporangium mesophilum]